jgi:hypothetical protein
VLLGASSAFIKAGRPFMKLMNAILKAMNDVPGLMTAVFRPNRDAKRRRDAFLARLDRLLLARDDVLESGRALRRS